MAGPFPDPYPTLLADDPLLGSALETAIGEALAAFPSLEQPLRVPISFVAINDAISPLDFKHAGTRFGDTFYSASLLKVAAMYAAYELLNSANALASSSGVGTSQELFAQLHAEFDDVIDASVPLIGQTPGITRTMRLPKYEQIFAAVPLTTGGVACAFSGPFSTNMRKMIVNSDNSAAAACIMALGYSWINGALKAGGFFFPPAQAGVWLAGTFTGAMPPVRIPSVNDGPIAQGTTCFDLANLYAHLFQGTLVPVQGSAASPFSGEMLAVLAVTADVGADPSFMDFTRRPGLPPRTFGVTHTKIGLGPLKTGQNVCSEGTIVEHIDTGRKFLVVWQNSLNDDRSLIAIGTIVERTIELFLFA
jgi:hypothetical protein